MILALGVLVVSISASATDSLGVQPSAEPSASESGDVVLAHGRDRTASETLSDWATYADHVLVVTVLDEERGTPSRKETARGEGMIARSVHLRVDEVLWSAPDSAQRAPATLAMTAPGWVFNDNNGTGTAELALAHSSRLERGHTYIRAVEWLDDPCSPSPQHGQWVGLGSGGTIPYDEGVLGAGEFEGRVQSVDQAKAKVRTEDPGVRSARSQAIGKPLQALVAGLREAPVRVEEGFGPAECRLTDR